METQFNEKVLNELRKMNKNLGLITKQMRLPEEQWLDTADVCQRLRISDRKLAYQRKLGNVPYIKKGAKLYYHVMDVDNYPLTEDKPKNKQS